MADRTKRSGIDARKGVRAARRALSRTGILAAALAEIDAGGVDAFNLRNLARRLGVYPTAIYWYYPTKNHLLAEIAAVAFRGVAPRQAASDWPAALRTIFVRFRRVMKRHPNIAPLVGTQLVGNLAIDLAFAEGVLACLRTAGLRDSALVHGYNTVVASLVGFVVQEFSPMPLDGTSAWQAEIRARLAAVDGARYPVLAANLDVLANKAFILRWQNGERNPLNASFDAFVNQVIAGIGLLAVSPGMTTSAD